MVWSCDGHKDIHTLHFLLFLCLSCYSATSRPLCVCVSRQQEFASRLHYHVVREYVGQLMKNNYSCKNRKHKRAADKISKQWTKLRDLFEDKVIKYFSAPSTWTASFLFQFYIKVMRKKKLVMITTFPHCYIGIIGLKINISTTKCFFLGCSGWNHNFKTYLIYVFFVFFFFIVDSRVAPHRRRRPERHHRTGKQDGHKERPAAVSGEIPRLQVSIANLFEVLLVQ